MFRQGHPFQMGTNSLEQLIKLLAEVAGIKGALSQIEWDLLCLVELDFASNPEALNASLNTNRPKPKKPAKQHRHC